MFHKYCYFTITMWNVKLSGIPESELPVCEIYADEATNCKVRGRSTMFSLRDVKCEHAIKGGEVRWENRALL